MKNITDLLDRIKGFEKKGKEAREEIMQDERKIEANKRNSFLPPNN